MMEHPRHTESKSPTIEVVPILVVSSPLMNHPLGAIAFFQSRVGRVREAHRTSLAAKVGHRRLDPPYGF